MADGIQSWSVLGVYLIAAVSLFLSAQPWRSFLELTPDGFRSVWGVQSTFVRWRDVGGLRPVLAPSGQYGGVAFSASRQIQDILGWRRTVGGVNGTLNGALYGVSDGKLYQLMYNLRSRAVYGGTGSEAQADSAATTRASLEVGEG
nr:B314 [uncultured bacterium]